MVKEYARECSVQAFIEEVPRLTATLGNTDDAGNQIYRRTADITARFGPDFCIGKILIQTCIDLAQHFRQVEFNLRLRNREAAADIQNAQLQACCLSLFKKLTCNIQRMQIGVSTDSLAAYMKGNPSHIQACFLSLLHQSQRIFTRCTEFFIQINMCRGIVDTQSEQYSRIRALFFYFIYFTGAVKGHLAYTAAAAGLQAYARLYRISVNQTTAIHTHIMQGADFSVACYVKAGAHICHHPQNFRMRISLNRVMNFDTRHIFFQNLVVLFDFIKRKYQQRCTETHRQFFCSLLAYLEMFFITHNTLPLLLHLFFLL